MEPARDPNLSGRGQATCDPEFPFCAMLPAMKRVGAVLMLFAAAGCGGDDEKTVLRVWDWWSPVEGEKTRTYFREVEAAFERDYPHVDLRFQHIPFGAQYIQKIMASMAAGRPPDVLHASIIWSNDLYERGVLSNLRPYVNRTPAMADDMWLPTALNYGRDGDFIYGMPIEHDASAIVYNLALFEEAGVATDPLALATWGDLRDAALKLTKRDADGKVVQAGLMVNAVDISSYLPWLYSNDGRFYSQDRRRAAFNSPEMLEAMQFLHDLQHRDNVSFPIATERQDMRLFFQGKAAMFVGGTWTGHIVEEQAPNLRFQMTSFPKGPRGTRRGGMTWTNQMCVPRGAKHPDLAWEFITFYCGMGNALWKLESVERNSPLAAFYSQPEWQTAVKEHPSLEQVPQITNAGGPYPVVRFTELDDVFRPLMEGYMLNTLTAREVLDTAEAKVNRILERYYAQLAEAYR